MAIHRICSTCGKVVCYKLYEKEEILYYFELTEFESDDNGCHDKYLFCSAKCLLKYIKQFLAHREKYNFRLNSKDTKKKVKS